MNEMLVIAHNAHDMAHAQKELVSWAESKTHESLADRTEAEEALTQAQKNGWATRALKTAVARARQASEFYHKMLAALRLGYVIVPNLPIDVLAIRTTSDNPQRLENSWLGARHLQSSNSPALGEGRYVSADPTEGSETWREKNEDGREITKHRSWAEAFKDVAFPVKLARASVMDDTAKAMVGKIFDEIGIAPEGSVRARHADPMVVGQIIYRPKNHRVSFLIAWWMSNRDLEIRR